MARYDITHTCGHESVVRLTRKSSYREWMTERLEGQLCDSCWQAEKARRRAEENSAAAAANAAAGLPELTGSEKQVAWAETIRRQKLDTLESVLREPFDRMDADPVRLDAALNAIRIRPEARWWIDNRDTRIQELLRREYVATETPLPEEDAELARQAEAEAKAESTVRPPEPVTETVAEITISGNTISVRFPERREDFRELVRFKLHYKSNGTVWHRKIGFRAGSPEERAVELGHRLLTAGFIVRIFDPALRRRAVAGEYEPECRRWVTKIVSGPHAGWFCLEWPRPDNLYDAAKRISGSRYSKPHVIVPPEQFAEVLDFAEIYSFELSTGAQEIVESARQARDAALIAQPAEKKTRSPKRGRKQPGKLEIPAEVTVPDEFKD